MFLISFLLIFYGEVLKDVLDIWGYEYGKEKENIDYGKK